MIIEKFKPFWGENCETTMLGNLLTHNGMQISEPMLFGIGEGIGFIYWDSKQMGYPFLGGRCKQDTLSENIARNLRLSMEIKETASIQKAWDYVKSKIDSGIPVGLKLDFYYLDYIPMKIHFAGHYATIYGYDDVFGYLIDSNQKGIQVKSSLTSIADARNAKGPMSSKNKSFIINEICNDLDLKSIIAAAIRNNASEYLNPPIQNLSFNGIRKAAKLIGKWFDTPRITPDNMIQVGSMMEEAGTGGALFRNLYRDFLKECDVKYPELGLHEAYINFSRIAPMWTEVATLISSAGESMNRHKLLDASEILMDIANLEEKTMKILLEEK